MTPSQMRDHSSESMGWICWVYHWRSTGCGSTVEAFVGGFGHTGGVPMLGQHRGQRTKTGSQAVHNARLQANMSCPWHWFWLGSPHHWHAMCSTSSARHRCLVKSRRLSALPAMRLMRGWRVRAKSRRTVGCWSILDLLGTTSPSLHTCSKFAWRQSKMRTLTNPRHRGTNGRFSSQRRSSFPEDA